jgi:uncharacterized membrane protein
MTNLIIVSFKNEAKAMEASQKLNDLDSMGDITIYERVIVKKNPDGKTEVLQADTTEGMRTLSGLAVGSLIGALAGPVGVLLGMFTGTMTGAVLESDYYSFSEDFGSKAVEQLQPDTLAIIAEIEEDNNVFVDSTLLPLSLKLLRTDVDYEYDKYSDEQIEAFDEEIARERASIKTAAAAEKGKILQKISDLKEKRTKRINELKEKAKSIVDDVRVPLTERKISRLKASIGKHQTKIAQLEKELREMEH